MFASPAVMCMGREVGSSKKSSVSEEVLGLEPSRCCRKRSPRVDLTNDYSKGSPASGSLPERCERLALPSDLPSELVLAGLAGWLLTFVTAARVHAGLEVLGVWAGDTEVQLRLQHALPHPLAFVTSGGAAG